MKDNILEQIPGKLLPWYQENKRTLPWRSDPTPYHVWVSEIMLQQTRVEAVKSYYDRFMEQLPSIEALAQVEERQLLKLWEGLGYYSRARNLQAAALQIMDEYGGEMPCEYEKLLKLKGIGSYTAGAIGSIAFHKPYPAVDGNVLRVLSRVRRDERSITADKVKKEVFSELREVMPGEASGDFNQALMDLGATVCIPNGEPLCEKCPLREICEGHKAGCATEYPVKEAKKARTIEKKTVLLVQDGKRAAIRKRPSKGLLAGLYEFPMLEGHLTAEEVLEYVRERGLSVLRILPLTDSKHIFSHKEWHMIGYQLYVDELASPSEHTELREWLYLEPDTTQGEYPIPSAFSAYVPYLQIKLTGEKYK